MARALRLQFPGAIYHVTTRGNERRSIYRDDADRRRFLEKLQECVEIHHIRLYAFVLMSNHFHLLAETPRANLVVFMQQLNSSYSIYFNCRHGRSGHLFGGRYKAKVVEGDEYLLKLTRYLHLNPVAIRSRKSLPLEEKIKILRGYRWSSYPAYAGLSPPAEWVDYGPLSELVGKGRRRRALAYRRYVEGGVAESDEELQNALECSSKAIGLESFCRWAEARYRELGHQQGQPLDVAMRRVEHPLDSGEVLRAVCEQFRVEVKDLRGKRQVSDARLLAMKLLTEEAGLTQREVATALGLGDGSGVSRSLSRLHGRLATDGALRSQLLGCRERLGHIQ